MFLNRLPERKSGVYLLVGRNIGDDAVHLYIGLIENLQTGSQNLQFSGSLTCRDAIAFTDSNGILNRSQLIYLKFYLLHLAKQAANVVLDNMNDSLGCNISVNDKVVADSFLADLLLILKALGINFFDPPVPDVSLSHSRLYYLKSVDSYAKMVIFQGKYVVLKGSVIRKQEVESCLPHTRAKRKNLKRSGALRRHNTAAYIATKNLVFNSSSFAASVVCGSNINGKKRWKNAEGRSLEELGL